MSVALLTVLACQYIDTHEPYYSGKAPQVADVLGSDGVGAEIGNLGGYDVNIQGSGFGDDSTAIVVFFGSTNAVIKSVSDTEIVAVSPKGPIEGGAVDVRVATLGGVGVLEGGYVYDVTDLFDDQVAYIQVNDFYYSAYGGSSPYGGRDVYYFDDDDDPETPDQGVAFGFDTFSYMGKTGFDGAAALYGSRFGRVHSVEYGWSGGADWSEVWAVQTPAYNPYLAWTDDLREELPTPDEKIRLRNPELEGVSYCADLRTLATWYYGGDDEHAAYTLPSYDEDVVLYLTDEGDCDDGATLYDASVMQICEEEEYQTDTNAYAVEYPVPIPFFMARGEGAEDPDIGMSSCFDGDNNDGRTEEQGFKVRDLEDDDCHSCFDGVDNDEDGLVDGDDSDCHPTILLDAEDTGLHEVQLTLPEPILFNWAEGFDAANDAGAPEFWGLSGGTYTGGPVLGLDECFDSLDDDDLVPDLDEAGLRLTWRPSGFLPSDDPAVVDVQTNVRVALTVMNLGWFGGEGYPFRASIQVPDDNNYDTLFEGLSYVDVPVEVLYQLPDVTFIDGGCSTNLGGEMACSWASPLNGNYGYLFVTVDRVTEYRLHSDHPKVGGDLIFSYNTGDFGFQSFDHPLDNDGCSDCEDGDGDGWPDDFDPDCELGDVEDGSNAGVYSCNDDFDNDGDGDIDQEDSDCASGYDLESGDCSDGEDNDGDGWIDDLDAECSDTEPGVELGELGEDTTPCADGEDNDGDGWSDSEDPGCTAGADPEDDGFGGEYECNDGLDNDGNGDVDAEDPGCAEHDAGFGTEQPEFILGCIDAEDGDEDGYIDELDPDCDYTKSQEWWAFHELEDHPLTARACYDGEDNDSDGLIDADDPACWGGAQFDLYGIERSFAPSGWLDDEKDNGSCTDEADGDADGLIDGDDPSCAPWFGASEDGGTCSDGLDQDGDGWIDADDPDCTTATDDESLSVRSYNCSNGVDDDDDGFIDSEDDGCSSGFDGSESS